MKDHPATIGLSVTISPPKSESAKPKVPEPHLADATTAPDSVPMLDLQRQYEQVRAEVLAAVGRVCASQHYILGTEVDALERELADFCGARDAVGCASGTDALWLALAAAGVQPGDQVLTTPFSFFASASAIVRAGARPVFADIDPLTFNLDVARVESFLRAAKRDNLRALLPVHLYGQCADMDSLQRLADEFHLPMIEDATMAEHMRRLRNHGSRRRYVHEEFGWTCRLDALQAAILRVKLKYVEGWNEARRRRAAQYDELFAGAGLTSSGEQTENSAPIQLPRTLAGAHHVFHQYVVRAFRREELREFLTARKIGTEVYYPLPLHLQPCFVYLGYREGDFPEAERAAKEVLALPMFPELTEKEQRWVVKSIADFYC